MIKRGIIVTILAAASLVPALLSGCSQNMINEGEANITYDMVIPLIDKILPVETETATFALG